MKNLFIAVLLLVTVVGISTQSRAEDVALGLDDRDWVLGHSAEDEKQGIQEYVLEGETVDNWSELITVQAFFGLQQKVSPEVFMEGMIQDFKKVCPNLKWSVLKKSGTDVVFEWETMNCPGQADQHEIDRIVSGKTALWCLHYVTKKVPIPPDRRDQWIGLLSSAKLRQ